MIEAIQQFLTNDKESNREVWRTVLCGIEYQIKQYAKIGCAIEKPISQRLEECQTSIDSNQAWYKKMLSQGIPYYFRSMAADRIIGLEKTKDKLVLKRKFMSGEVKGFSDEKIKLAKDYPIPDIIELNGAGFAKCLWHDEKTPSMKYYPKTNTCHCFGACAKNFDSIDVAMKHHNIGFRDAVNKLCTR